MKRTLHESRYPYMTESIQPCWLCGGKHGQLRKLPDTTLIHLCDRCLRIFQDAMLLDRAAAHPPATPDIAR
jgi:ribosomal protein S14